MGTAKACKLAEMFVMTIDQVASRSRPDGVDSAIARLSHLDMDLAFERTAGDEFQGATSSALSVVKAIVVLVEFPQWHIGTGVGAIEEMRVASVRSGRGPAFLAARAALEGAKQSGAVTIAAGTVVGAADAADATTAARLLTELIQRRSADGREAVRQARSGASQATIAERLKISRQAVGQRLAAARWQLQAPAEILLRRLLERTSGSSDGP